MSSGFRMSKLLRSPRSLLIISPFLLFAPVWLTGQAMYWGTPSTQFVPWWWQAWQTMLSGELPLWNPLAGMGAPLLANYQSALLYPPTWIYFALAAVGGASLMAWGQAILVAAHLAWAGWGMGRLIREMGKGELAQTVGGLAFALSGYLVARAHFLSINSTVAWLPWILWAAYRLAREPKQMRHTIVLAALFALQCLAGHAQTAWYTLLLAIAWTSFWSWQFGNSKRLGQTAFRLGLAGLLAFAISAIQLIPTAEYLLNSQRANQVDFAESATYSFWPWRLISSFSSNFFGNPAHGNYWGYGNFWEDAIYIGLLPLLLAFSALSILRRDKNQYPLYSFLTIVVCVSILLALGSNTLLFRWLYDHVPSFSLFQSPTRFSIWLVFALALLAGFQVEKWRVPKGKALYWSRLAVAGAAAILLTAMTASVLGEGIPQVIALALVPTGVVGVAMAIMHLRQAKLKANWAWVVSGLIAVDLLFAGWGLNPGASANLYGADVGTTVIVEQQLGDGRLYLPVEDERALKFEHLFRFDDFFNAAPIKIRQTALPNMFLLDRVRSANNFDPFVPAAYKNWVDAVTLGNQPESTTLLAEAGVTVIEQVGDSGDVQFLAVDGLPRARWMNCEEAAVRITDAVGCEPAARGVAAIVTESANSVTLVVQSDGGWLLLADTWFPGWKAIVDGEERDIYQVDGIYRAVQLESGDKQVSFVYAPLSFAIGATLSWCALLAAALLWRRSGLRS